MKLLDVNGEPTAFLHIHLAIFLELGPKSLKSARLVSRDWNRFIKSQIWMNKKVRKGLEKRLAQQWRMKRPMTRQLVLGEERMVDMICCNETHFAIFCRAVEEDLLEGEPMRLRLYTAVYSLYDMTQIGEEREVDRDDMIYIWNSCAMGKSVIAASRESHDSDTRELQGLLVVRSGEEEGGLAELYRQEMGLQQELLRQI